jgi:hypothetical protein
MSLGFSPRYRSQITRLASGVLALLGGHHVDIARHKIHLLTPALGAFRFRGFMLGDGLGAFNSSGISRNDIDR